MSCTTLASVQKRLPSQTRKNTSLDNSVSSFLIKLTYAIYIKLYFAGAHLELANNNSYSPVWHTFLKRKQITSFWRKRCKYCLFHIYCQHLSNNNRHCTDSKQTSKLRLYTNQTSNSKQTICYSITRHVTPNKPNILFFQDRSEDFTLDDMSYQQHVYRVNKTS